MSKLFALIVALVASYLLSTVVADLFGLLGGVRIVIWLILFVVTVILVNSAMRRALENADSGKYPQGFNATYQHDNIAIDQPAGKLWLRDKKGVATVVDKNDILRWNVTYDAQGRIHFNHHLDIHIRDLNRPKFQVPFKRHGDRHESSCARNSDEASEWASRLTTWVNNT